ncbi:hypothetical protein PGT21_014887 [Puccinia graminis f. sp. tritici]|uniref:Uncharacterized protein n=1 Tax=Puccinia graminis f. sp. tritici TaxID=56615 RepID=A0A5B0RBW4_PUCGR|nr:hypothetical protein PGT21_014887 [Puccinia graminis f. sp. tritici]KAA1122563.1 hypothetical protein PGTUg99_037795 [Puccinia graminis f. sp. tritici]
MLINQSSRNAVTPSAFSGLYVDSDKRSGLLPAQRFLICIKPDGGCSGKERMLKFDQTHRKCLAKA